MLKEKSAENGEAQAWARDVVEGRVLSGALMRGACARFLADLESSKSADYPFRYDPSKGEKFRLFCLHTLKHYRGEHAKKPVELVPAQLFIFGNVLGWLRKDNGLRRFKVAYIEVPRKNGKSAMLSCLSLYMLAMDGEEGAECYTLATKRDQAKIVFNDAIKMMPPATRERFRERYKQLHFEPTNSKLEPLSSDSNTLDGLNPHFACADEIHAWTDRNLWDVVEDGMGSRQQPLLVAITTAGSNKEGFCYTLRKTAVSLCEDEGRGAFRVDSFFSFIACADPEDRSDWRNPRIWAKANPMLGVSKRIDYMIQQVERCEAEPSKINAFLNKQLNIWTDAETRWLDADEWSRGAVTGLAELMQGRKCWGGLDLARVHDLSSLALVFPPDDEVSLDGMRVATPADAIGHLWKLLVWHWCPEENVRQRVKRDRVPYDQWLIDGWITSTPGSVTDYTFVRAAVMEIVERFQVQDIGFDRMFASETVQALGQEGIEMVEFGQGFLSMASPTSELERMLRGGELVHQGNPVLDWQAGNVVVEQDAAGNLKPSKRKSRERIDGIVASIMALGRAKVALAEDVPYAGMMII